MALEYFFHIAIYIFVVGNVHALLDLAHLLSLYPVTNAMFDAIVDISFVIFESCGRASSHLDKSIAQSDQVKLYL